VFLNWQQSTASCISNATTKLALHLACGSQLVNMFIKQ
jgi:hypothetical protein